MARYALKFNYQNGLISDCSLDGPLYRFIKQLVHVCKDSVELWLFKATNWLHDTLKFLGNKKLDGKLNLPDKDQYKAGEYPRHLSH